MTGLPIELSVQIFARVDAQALVTLSETCSSFRQAILEHQLFKAAAQRICPWLTEPIKETWEATVRYLLRERSYTPIKSYDTNEILASFPSVQFKADLDIAFEHEEAVDPDGRVMFETQRSQLDSTMFRVSPEGDGYIYMSPSMSSNVQEPQVMRINCETLKAEKVMDGYLLGDPEVKKGGVLVNYTGQRFSVPEGEISHQTVVDGKLFALLRRYNEVYLLRGDSLLRLPFAGRKQVDIRLHIVHGHAFFTATSLISLTPQATKLYVVGRDSDTVHPLFDCHPYDIPHNFAVHGEHLYLCKEMKLFQLFCNAEEGKTYLVRIINNPVHYAATKTYGYGKYLFIKSFAGSQVLFDLDNDSMSHIIHDRDVNCIMKYEDELVCFCFSKSMLLRLGGAEGGP